jgi:hypothetical protein
MTARRRPWRLRRDPPKRALRRQLEALIADHEADR